MTFLCFVDICPPREGIGFVLFSEKNELCATSYSTNLDLNVARRSFFISCFKVKKSTKITVLQHICLNCGGRKYFVDTKEANVVSRNFPVGQSWFKEQTPENYVNS